jgi:hypothetical protein
VWGGGGGGGWLKGGAGGCARWIDLSIGRLIGGLPAESMDKWTYLPSPFMSRLFHASTSMPALLLPVEAAAACGASSSERSLLVG